MSVNKKIDQITQNNQNVRSLVSGPLQRVLLKICETKIEEHDPFENAAKESERIEIKLKEKEVQLKTFQKQVKKRVNTYINVQKKVNADQNLAVTKSSNIIKPTSLLGNSKFFDNEVALNRINDAKKNLASKTMLRSKSTDLEIQNPEETLPGGNWQRTNSEAQSDAKIRPISAFDGSSKTLPNFVLRSLLHSYKSSASCQNEHKKRVNQTRKLFSDLERDQVKNDILKSNEKILMKKLKTEKERERVEKEREMNNRKRLHAVLMKRQVDRVDSGPKTVPSSARSTSSINTVELNPKTKLKELNRYIEALKEQIKEKACKNKIDLPPLCQCNQVNCVWEFNPNNCANNCIFYKNPKEYAKALQNLLNMNEN